MNKFANENSNCPVKEKLATLQLDRCREIKFRDCVKLNQVDVVYTEKEFVTQRISISLAASKG